MRRRQVVYRTLPHRQAAHESFFSMIAGKYGAMQRHANRLSLTHRLMAAPSRRRQPGSAPVPVHVQVALPSRTPNTVREVIREVPVYRERPSPATQPNPTVQSTQPVVRERIVERKETVVRERIVEKQVVVVREAERLIREQQLLRERAITQPLRGSEADGPSAPTATATTATTKQLPPQDRSQRVSSPSSPQQGSGQLPSAPDQTTQHRRSQKADTPTSQLETATQHDRPLTTDGQPAAKERPTAHRINHERTRASASDDSIHKLNRKAMKQSAAPAQTASIFARQAQPVQMILRNQTWPLTVSRKSGWRTDRDGIAAAPKGNAAIPPGHQRKARQKKQQTEGDKHRSSSDQQKTVIRTSPSSVPVHLLYRQMSHKQGATDRSAWRAVPVGRLFEAYLSSAPSLPDDLSATGGQSPASGELREMTVRAFVASHRRLQRLQPLSLQHRMAAEVTLKHQRDANDPTFAQRAVRDSAVTAKPSSSKEMPRAARHDALHHRLMRREGTPGRASFLQGDALHDRTVSVQLRRQPQHAISGAAERTPQQPPPHAGARQSPSSLGSLGGPDRDTSTVRYGQSAHDAAAVHDGQSPSDDTAEHYGSSDKPGQSSGAAAEALPVIRLRRSSTLGRWPSLATVHARKRHPQAIHRTPLWIRGASDDHRQLPTFAREVTGGMQSSAASHAKQRIERASLVHRERSDRSTGGGRPVQDLISPTQPTAAGRDPQTLRTDATVSSSSVTSVQSAADHPGERPGGGPHAALVQRQAVQTARIADVRQVGTSSQLLYRSGEREQDKSLWPQAIRLMPRAQPLVPLVVRSLWRNKQTAAPSTAAQQRAARIRRMVTQPGDASALLTRTSHRWRDTQAATASIPPAAMAFPRQEGAATAAQQSDDSDAVTALTGSAVHGATLAIASPGDEARIIRRAQAPLTVLRKLASTSPWAPQRAAPLGSAATSAGASDTSVDAKFEHMFPLDYAVTGRSQAAQAVAAQAAGQTATSFAASDGEHGFTPMELRKQPAPLPAASRQPEAAVQESDQPPMSPEQLQQAIGKMNMLNPDQIAEQVYKALAKRLRFERRLQGY